MTEPYSASHAVPAAEASIPAATLPALLQLVHSATSLARKHSMKRSRKAAAPAPPKRAEWYECPDRMLPSVSSF